MQVMGALAKEDPWNFLSNGDHPQATLKGRTTSEESQQIGTTKNLTDSSRSLP